jgi:hypothetical protein
MPGSTVFSGGGGMTQSAPTKLLAMPPAKQTVTATIGVSVSGVNAQGDAPFWQTIAISAAAATTLPSSAISSSTPFKTGQRLTLINEGIHPITIPENGFGSGYLAETIEPRHMVELFYNGSGWVQLDDDAGADSLPKTWRSNPWPDGDRGTMTESGFRLRSSNSSTKAPVARMDVTSIALKSTTPGSPYVVGYEDYTVMGNGGTPVPVTLPDPLLFPNRILVLISEIAAMPITVTGGGGVRVGQSQILNSVPAAGGMTIQSINGSWRKIAGF